MVEELVINGAIGLLLVAAFGFAFYLPVDSRGSKNRKTKQERALEEAEKYSESLITQEDSFVKEFYPTETRTSTVDGYKVAIKVKAVLTRGVSNEDEKNYDDAFNGKEEVRNLIYSTLVDEACDAISAYLKWFSIDQLYYYEHEFEKEVAKTVDRALSRYGLILNDFSLSIKRLNIEIDLNKATERSFEDIIAMALQRGDLREYLKEVRNNGTPQKGTQQSYLSLSSRLERLEESWMEYELNPNLLLNYPLMSDASCEETANFFLRIGQAQALCETAKEDESSLGEFASALEGAELAFVKAESNAKKVRLAYLSSEQRKAVEKSRPLVAMYRDEEASPQERINAFKKANRNLEGIMMLPERPIMGLLEAAQ